MRWLRLPTGTAACRLLFQQLSINDEEQRLVAMPSGSDGRQFGLGCGGGDNMAARIIRRESYFRAVLIHSRGNPAPVSCTK